MFQHYTLKLVRPQCHTRSTVNAIVEVDADLRGVMPYLNAELGSCFFHPEGPFLRFTQGGKTFTLHPRHFTIGGLADEEEARKMVAYVQKLLAETWARRQEITPSYRRGREVKVLEVYKLLPRTNCGVCGVKSCMAFAAGLLQQEFLLEDCAPLNEPERAPNREELARLLKEAGLRS